MGFSPERLTVTMAVPGVARPQTGAIPRMRKFLFENNRRVVIHVTIDVVALLFGLAALISLLK